MKEIKTEILPVENESRGITFNYRTSPSPKIPTSRKKEDESNFKKDVDFIGPASVVKDLFTLPFRDNDEGVSVALHNMNGTLLVDTGDPTLIRCQDNDHIHRKTRHDLSGSDSEDMNQEVKPCLANISTSVNDRNRKILKRGHTSKATNQVFVGSPPDFGSRFVEGSAENSTLAVISDMMQQHQIQCSTKYSLDSNSSEMNYVQKLDEKSTGIVVGSSTNNRTSNQMEDSMEILGHSQSFRQKSSVDESTGDDNSCLLDVLPTPNYYARNIVLAPEPPRQYLHWKFHKYKFLVGSDALIYGKSPNALEESIGGKSWNSSQSKVQQDDLPSHALTVRLADGLELRSKLSMHEERINSTNSARYSNTHCSENQKQKEKTYAEVLSHPSVKLFDESRENAKECPVEMIKADVKVGDGEKNNIIPLEKCKKSRSIPEMEKFPLQTCVVPSTNIESHIRESRLMVTNPNHLNNASENLGSNTSGTSASSSPVCTVLDAYLDNIIANVPQMALCLQEKGFIQSIKLLRTENIPNISTYDLETNGMEYKAKNNNVKSNIDKNLSYELFSPDAVDSNATTLLSFLKTNCSQENSTYLLRRNAGETNIQLFDITSISRQRQLKWIWWLAMMSYRFALRLEQLAKSIVPMGDKAVKRNFRARQRSLLQNSLELLDELADMDGGKHDTICAAINEHLADTFLRSNTSTEEGIEHSLKMSQEKKTNINNSEKTSNKGCNAKRKPLSYNECDKDFSSSCSTFNPATFSSQPYSNINIDGLSKAQDNLISGIQRLEPVLHAAFAKKKKRIAVMKDKQQQFRNNKKESLVIQAHVNQLDNNDKSKHDLSSNMCSSGGINEESESMEIEAISLQLYGIHHKLINVSLRLAEHYLRNYSSSSAMQALRTAGRRIAGAAKLTRSLNLTDDQQNNDYINIKNSNPFSVSIFHQYAWLWEICGHFARSFAADDLWRERGHACGDDIISLLREVDHSSCVGIIEKDDDTRSDEDMCWNISPITSKSKGLVTFNSLSALVPIFNNGNDSENIADHFKDAIDIARSILENQKQLKHDKRCVLVASTICYSRAIGIFSELIERIKIEKGLAELPHSGEIQKQGILFPLNVSISFACQRLGDACNEIGKILLGEVKNLISSSVVIDKKNNQRNFPAGPILISAEFWFSQGLDHFEKCGDARNVALLRCNLCQCCKMHANTNFVGLKKIKDISNTLSKESHSEFCLQDAAKHLELAHESLDQRNTENAMTWDMVSEELGATFLILGVKRRQSLIGGGSTPLIAQALRLNPGKERSIIEPMNRALEIYKSLGNDHQAAAANYQLALFYSKVWTCQRDELKTREHLSAAFNHFSNAQRYFFSHMRSNEPTFVVLSLDLSNLYSAVSGESDCLHKALLCCLDTCDSFSNHAICDARDRQYKSDLIQDSNDWFEKMRTLASCVEERVLKLLLNLVRIEKENTNKSIQKPEKGAVSKFKSLYRIALIEKQQCKGKDVEKVCFENCEYFPVYDLLMKLKEEKTRLKNSGV